MTVLTSQDGISAPVRQTAILILTLISALMLIVGLLMLPKLPGRAPVTQPATRIAAHVPKVEPAAIIPMAEDRARAVNAAIPFAPGRVTPAARYRFRGDAADRERAIACLAAASWYEAGDDPVGQQAVVQVVLNRARHPAFPKSVCGVVFQGSGLRTGCQFSFTCDGSLRRRPSDDARARARAIAERALDGSVLSRVGYATHYHTDWVVPYWSGSLDKIARVGTHLFFRWRDGWGEPRAFTDRQGAETLDPRILAFADIGKLPAGDVAGLAEQDPVRVEPGAGAVRLSNSAAGEFVLALITVPDPRSYRAAALRICGDRSRCRVTGWVRADRIPAALPISLSALRSAAFAYRRNRAAGIDNAAWNCRQIGGIPPTDCIPGTGPLANDAPPLVVPPPLPATIATP